MAYTRAWTTTTPADSDQASTLGAAGRNLRTDIQERMNTLLNGTWANDPVGGFPITVVQLIAAMRGRESGAGWQDNTGSGTQFIPSGTTSATKEIQLDLPVGVTLTRIRASTFIIAAAAGSPNMKVVSVYVTQSGGGSAGTALTITSANPAHDSAWHWMDIALAPYTVLAGDQIVVIVQGNNGAGGGSQDARYGGLEVTYTKPNLLTGW